MSGGQYPPSQLKLPPQVIPRGGRTRLFTSSLPRGEIPGTVPTSALSVNDGPSPQLQDDILDGKAVITETQAATRASSLGKPVIFMVGNLEVLPLVVELEY
jgi:hypothetical protein